MFKLATYNSAITPPPKFCDLTFFVKIKCSSDTNVLTECQLFGYMIWQMNIIHKLVISLFLVIVKKEVSHSDDGSFFLNVHIRKIN